MLNENKLNMLKKIYQQGMKVQLIDMDDIQAPPANTIGTIMFVDAIGQIHVKWDNGSTLALNDELDEFKII